MMLARLQTADDRIKLGAPALRIRRHRLIISNRCLIVSETSASRWKCLAGLLTSIKAWSGMEAACNLSRSCVSLLSADAFLQVRDAECNRGTSIRNNGVSWVADSGFAFLSASSYVGRCGP
jgi:hypothetical protein